jgi:hypothetical protein
VPRSSLQAMKASVLFNSTRTAVAAHYFVALLAPSSLDQRGHMPNAKSRSEVF